MTNYFNYFTEIEDRFQQRRGSLLMLSTLDWALIETWREAQVPLEAVLRGIDTAFDKHDAQLARAGARRPRKVNGLAWCAQAVLEAVEQSREAAIGTAPTTTESRDSGFEAARIAAYLNRNATQLEAAANHAPAAAQTAARLRTLATQLQAAPEPDSSSPAPLLSSRSEAEGSASPSATTREPLGLEDGAISLEMLDRTLTVLEEKLYTSLLASAPEDQLVALRAQADRELAPYRGKMQAVQIKQVQQQLLQKRLLEAHKLPRLSLFYMPHEEEA
ncbi:MAG TPA: hypothetical protein VGU46_07515 [Acidobacteriaceae bacterium]|nr:hypothetical protein [Acidobacteriaceae bacterium]